MQIDSVLDELAADHLQDDTRFLETYIRYRREAGYGPRRILTELAERGVKEIPDELAKENSTEWLTALERVWQKKFGHQRPLDLKIKAKQTRFLIYRGFAPEQVHYYLRVL